MSIETDFEAWYAEQGRIWAANPRRKQYPLTAEGVQEGLKDASRLAYQAATERAAKLDGAEIAAYELPAPGAGPIDQVRIERVRQMDGSALWAVRFRGEVLNKRGEWEWEPMPSSRDDAFLARARFSSAEKAIAAIRAASTHEGGGKRP